LPPKLSVWKHLLETYHQRADELPESALTVRGVWKCEYALRATPRSSTLNLSFILVQTDLQGCCHVQAEDDMRQHAADVIGLKAANLFLNRNIAQPIRIASLDAVYGSLIGEPNIDHVILGTNSVKASRRARIVCQQALRLLDMKPYKYSAPRILNVGCIGDFLAYIRDERPEVMLDATDFALTVVDRTYHGVTVQSGSETPRLVAEADVAIVTGMTLQTSTLDEIIEVAHEHGTRLVMFAETGANFAEEYCKLGVDVVVSEPFPFYLMARGASELRIYQAVKI
jgi:hypothetical protein